MAQCRICNNSSKSISKELSVCLKCIREKPEDSLPLAMQAHKMSRSAFGLPENPPRDSQGLPCKICVNECRIPENGTGYCGVRKNEGGRYVGHTFNNKGHCNEMSQSCSRRRGQKCEDRECTSARLVIPLNPPLVKED